MSDSFFVVAAALFGATIGSYLNVVIYRTPRRGERDFGSRSVCVHCGAPVPGWLNVPILSWILLRGRTRCCKQPLSLRYPLVESLTAVMFAMLALAPPSGLGLRFGELSFAALAAFVFHAYFVSNLIANTFIDIDFRILPDRLTMPLMVVGVLVSVVVPGLSGPPFEQPAWFGGAITSLIGLVAGYGLCYLIRAGAHAAFGKEAMGFGDVKLIGGIGAFLGWQGAVVTFFAGAVFGAIGGLISKAVSKDPYVAFGPYLALGAVVTLFFQDGVIEFLTVTWPQWQREHASSPWALVAIGLVSLVLLFVLVRRGRSS